MTARRVKRRTTVRRPIRLRDASQCVGMDKYCFDAEGRTQTAGLKLLRPEDVAHILGVPIKYVHQLVRNKELRCVQLTKRIRRFRPEDLQEFIDSRVQGEPRRVDKAPRSPLPYEQIPGKQKGGQRKSVEDGGTSLTAEEIRGLCQ